MVRQASLPTGSLHPASHPSIGLGQLEEVPAPDCLKRWSAVGSTARRGEPGALGLTAVTLCLTRLSAGLVSGRLVTTPRPGSRPASQLGSHRPQRRVHGASVRINECYGRRVWRQPGSAGKSPGRLVSSDSDAATGHRARRGSAALLYSHLHHDGATTEMSYENRGNQEQFQCPGPRPDSGSLAAARRRRAGVAAGVRVPRCRRAQHAPNEQIGLREQIGVHRGRKVSVRQ